mmetsp:Transcript_7036/g.20550  ORF Transcript_7036/g.20550 Transcript_7036/m.20550 type:complete len:264 (-) Transcript_7036:217-1008(-)
MSGLWIKHVRRPGGVRTRPGHPVLGERLQAGARAGGRLCLGWNHRHRDPRSVRSLPVHFQDAADQIFWLALPRGLLGVARTKTYLLSVLKAERVCLQTFGYKISVGRAALRVCSEPLELLYALSDEADGALNRGDGVLRLQLALLQNLDPLPRHAQTLLCAALDEEPQPYRDVHRPRIVHPAFREHPRPQVHQSCLLPGRGRDARLQPLPVLYLLLQLGPLLHRVVQIWNEPLVQELSILHDLLQNLPRVHVSHSLLSHHNYY